MLSRHLMSDSSNQLTTWRGVLTTLSRPATLSIARAFENTCLREGHGTAGHLTSCLIGRTRGNFHTGDIKNATRVHRLLKPPLGSYSCLTPFLIFCVVWEGTCSQKLILDLIHFLFKSTQEIRMCLFCWVCFCNMALLFTREI